MIEKALRDLLVGTAGVAAVVAQRVYPERLPQGARFPAITVQFVAGQSAYSMDGASGLANPRVQVDLYAEEKDAVVALKGAVMAALSGFRGMAGTPPVDIQGAFRVDESELPGDELDKAGPRVWRKRLDFIIWHEEDY